MKVRDAGEWVHAEYMWEGSVRAGECREVYGWTPNGTDALRVKVETVKEEIRQR